MDARTPGDGASAIALNQGYRSRSVTRALQFAPIIIVAVLPVLPFVNPYIQAATVRALIFIALGQAWNIVAGIGGQLSLGHGVFLGLGCYVTGILFNALVCHLGSVSGSVQWSPSW